jgi:hypothetical protein
VSALSLLSLGCGGGGWHHGSAATLTLHGRVVSTSGDPYPNVPIWILDQSGFALTDSNGNFELAGVTAPYTLIAVDDSGQAATVYVRLTRPDPTIWFQTASPYPFSAKVSGLVSGGTGFPQPATHATRFEVDLGYSGGLISAANATTGAYDAFAPFSWKGPSTTPISVTAAQYAKDAAGLPTTFTAAGFLDLPAVPDGAVLTSSNIAMAPVGTTTISGTYTMPPGYVMTGMSLSVQRSPLAGLNFPDDIVDDGAFALNGPTIAGATFAVQVGAQSPDAGSFVFRRGLAAGATGLVLPLRPGSQLIFPIDGATGVDPTTTFAYTPAQDGVHLLNVFPTGSGVTYMIVTADTVATLPDLTAIGLPLPSSADYSWFLTHFAPFADIDDFAATGPPFGTHDMIWYGGSGARTFTTGP